MNQKGFTLIELLAVLIILAVIMALVFPTVSLVLRNSRETISNTQANKILNSTYDYTLKNISKLPEKNHKIYITLNELKKEGFVDSDIINIDTREEYPNHLVISVENVGTNYKYDKSKSSLHGNYLYTIESDILRNHDYEEKKPTIVLNGYEETLTENVNINSKFEEPEYSATSSTGEDLTDSVIKNIIYNSKNTNSIDTSKVGIYYVNYTVVDDKGYSEGITLNIIVVDNEIPSLTIPDNVTISTSDTSYDLEEGVFCTDNSGECDITIKGEIEFGVDGKYTIEYIAKDPSGNTAVDRRIITVE